jgi:hypothetical protein
MDYVNRQAVDSGVLVMTLLNSHCHTTMTSH